MTTIGFAGKYYTLWNVTRKTIETEWERYDVMDCVYIKNISLDFDKAKALYPNADVNLNLKGQSSFSYRVGTYEEVNNDLFQCGRYKGEKIAECNDGEYMMWYADTNCYGERRKNVVNRLVELGYHAKQVGEDTWRIYTPEEWENVCAREKAKNEIIAKASNGEAIEFFAETNLKPSYDNPNDEWEVTGYDYYENGVTYRFAEAKEQYYAGYSYYIPSVNGKGKRIKNKNVRITDCTAERKDNGCVVINIKKFEVVK